MAVIKQALSYTLVRTWWHLPLTRQGKESIKTLVFTLLPFLFRNTRVYRNWDYTRRLGKPDFIFRPDDFPTHWPTKRIEPTAYTLSGSEVPSAQPPAIIIHVYYADLLPELLNTLVPYGQKGSKLFVSTTPAQYDTVAAMLAASGFRHHLEAFANRGRDILPFLKLAPRALAEGYPLLLKLHTKKSDHRMSGEIWRKELYSKLLQAGAVDRILEVFSKHPGVGLLGPAGHIVPMSLYYGGNARAVGYLAWRLGMVPQTLQGLHFIAGSMFFARAEALQPLLDLELGDELFEEEAGQRDSTMAHAVERAFAMSTYIAGYQLADSTATPGKTGYKETKDHKFTW